MKFSGTLLVVSDLERSKQFYDRVLDLKIEQDFGANVVLTGSISLQSLESWQQFIEDKPVIFGGNDSELYFETDDMDCFLQRLQQYDVRLLHPLKEHNWGQRAIRFYDPDNHIIEVGEPLEDVCLRFYLQGMRVEQIAVRMDVPLTLAEQWMKVLHKTKPEYFHGARGVFDC